MIFTRYRVCRYYMLPLVFTYDLYQIFIEQINKKRGIFLMQRPDVVLSFQKNAQLKISIIILYTSCFHMISNDFCTALCDPPFNIHLFCTSCPRNNKTHVFYILFSVIKY
jgi:hypothetical protein